MRNPFPYRRIFALAATYVVVLQALLLPLTVAAAAAPMAEGLCITASADTRAPASHDTGCACAAGCGMQCCGQGLLGAAPSAIAVALADFYVLAPAPALEPVVRVAMRRPQIPRAPPAG
ncbi:MAG: hypothetical protein Q8M24_16470 [Pseudolabrys sp.]|nr:hypothetical protein [Pseudolabrys sp.]MDP2297039.1 hypothetical protein [Pseudolabrys sp.]